MTTAQTDPAPTTWAGRARHYAQFQIDGDERQGLRIRISARTADDGGRPLTLVVTGRARGDRGEPIGRLDWAMQARTS